MASYTSSSYPKKDVDLALFLAALCYQGYQLPLNGDIVLPTWPQVTEFLTKLCGSTTLINEAAFGYIIQSSSSIYLVFRGTQNPLDWSANLDARKTRYIYVPNSGSVHHGFLSLYGSLRNNLLRKLSGLDSKKNLYITGHSLGGAIATLCALDVAVNSKFKQPAVITFAAPRVGDITFADKFNAVITKSERVINAQDHVPSVPPPELGFTHVKGGIVIDVYAGPNPVANHSISMGYFPGLAALDPTYARLLCANNPEGFCPPEANVSIHSVLHYPQYI